MSDDPADVLIIGAGASGAAMAWSLAETKMHIVCLEQGGLMNPLQYPSTGRDWEARAQSDMVINPNLRGLDSDYPINEDDSPIKVANFNGVGGGTVLFAGHFPRFHPSDFRVKSLDGVGDDWPIDYDTLVPFYGENDRMTGVAGLAGDPAYPRDNAHRLPPLPLGKSGQILAKDSTSWTGPGGQATPPSSPTITTAARAASTSARAFPVAPRGPKAAPT